MNIYVLDLSVMMSFLTDHNAVYTQYIKHMFVYKP